MKEKEKDRQKRPSGRAAGGLGRPADLNRPTLLPDLKIVAQREKGLALMLRADLDFYLISFSLHISLSQTDI